MTDMTAVSWNTFAIQTAKANKRHGQATLLEQQQARIIREQKPEASQ